VPARRSMRRLVFRGQPPSLGRNQFTEGNKGNKDFSFPVRTRNHSLPSFPSVDFLVPTQRASLQEPTPNAFASRRRKQRSSFGAKITPSLRLLRSVGLRVFADPQWSKNSAEREQEQEYEYELARTLGTGFGSFVSIRLPRRSLRRSVESQAF